MRCTIIIVAMMWSAFGTPLLAAGAVNAPVSHTAAISDRGNARPQSPFGPTYSVVSADARSATSAPHPWRAGAETATMPWSAPNGHHQPGAADIRGLASLNPRDAEDEKIDRVIEGVCRGC